MTHLILLSIVMQTGVPLLPAPHTVDRKLFLNPPTGHKLTLNQKLAWVQSKNRELESYGFGYVKSTGGVYLYRCAWEMPNHKTGHGEWMRDPTVVKAWVDYMNQKYPKTRHWMEKRRVRSLRGPRPRRQR